MSRISLAVMSLILGGMLLISPASARTAFSEEDAQAIRAIMHDYLLKNPEILEEVIAALREKKRISGDAEAKKLIKENSNQIFSAPGDPMIGNPKAESTVVEFFDYNCGYCKVSTDPIFDMVRSNTAVRVIFKELPILSEDSGLAARAALAAAKYGKYETVHRAFMKHRGKLDEKTIFHLIAESGLSADQIRKDMAAPDIEQRIKDNMQLARSMGITSTPTFIIGDRVHKGALDSQSLKQALDAARQ